MPSKIDKKIVFISSSTIFCISHFSRMKLRKAYQELCEMLSAMFSSVSLVNTTGIYN